MERKPLYLDFAAGELREMVSPDFLTPGGIKVYHYTADGTEGVEFEIVDLVDKNIIGVFRATDYKRVISGQPETTDHIGIEGTNNDENGILATGGVLLMAGDELIEGENLDFIYT